MPNLHVNNETVIVVLSSTWKVDALFMQHMGLDCLCLASTDFNCSTPIINAGSSWHNITCTPGSLFNTRWWQVLTWGWWEYVIWAIEDERERVWAQIYYKEVEQQQQCICTFIIGQINLSGKCVNGVGRSFWVGCKGLLWIHTKDREHTQSFSSFLYIDMNRRMIQNKALLHMMESIYCLRVYHGYCCSIHTTEMISYIEQKETSLNKHDGSRFDRWWWWWPSLTLIALLMLTLFDLSPSFLLLHLGANVKNILAQRRSWESNSVTHYNFSSKSHAAFESDGR